MARKRINIRAGFDLAEFSTSAQNLQREFKKTARKMTSIGKEMSMAFTLPFAALSGLSLVNFDAQAKSVAQVEAGIKSTGGAAGFTSKELQKMASELQKVSLFGDEDILKNVTAQLLTFTNVTGDAFAGAQQAVLDFSARTGRDLLGASVMIGKALNDPIAGLSALGKAGVQFTDEQKALIKSLMDTGDAAGAQAIVLKELENQYGGSAAAAAEAGTGPIMQLKNALMDVTESFGEIIMKGITPFVNVIKRLGEWVEGLSETTKKMIIVFGGVLAVIGPLLIGVGALVSLMGTFAAATGLALLPVLAIGLALAALAAAIVYVRDNLGAFANRWAKNWAIIQYKAIKAVTSILEAVGKVGKFLGLGDFSKTITNLQVKAGALRDEISSIGDVEFTSLGNSFDALKKKIIADKEEDASGGGDTSAAKAIQSKLADIMFEGQTKLKNIRDQFALTFIKDDEMRGRMQLENAQENELNALDFAISQLEKKKSLSQDEKAELALLNSEKLSLMELHLQQMAGLEDEQAANRISKAQTDGEKQLQIANNLQRKSNLELITNDEEFKAAELEREKNHLKALIKLKEQYGEDVSALQVQLAEKTRFESVQAAESVASGINMAFENAVSNLVNSVSNLLGDLMATMMDNAATENKDFGKQLMGVIGGFMSQFGGAMIAIGIAQTQIQLGLASMNPALAIAGGIALVAAGAALSTLSKKGLETSGGGGGTSTGSSGGVTVNGYDNEPIVLETRIEGNELILVQSRSNGFRR